MARRAVDRSGLYALLAAIYRDPPTAALLRTLRTDRFRDALSEAGFDLEAEFGDRPEDDVLLALAVEYTRLFIGPGAHIAPTEAAQTNGTLWAAATSGVGAFIEEHGFLYRPGYHGLPDHIAVELEFMHELTKREAAAWERRDAGELRRCLQAQKAFLTDHLSRWVPAFCKRVRRESECAFYREMAGLTADFVCSETDEIVKRAGNGDDAGDVAPCSGVS